MSQNNDFKVKGSKGKLEELLDIWEMSDIRLRRERAVAAFMGAYVRLKDLKKETEKRKK